MTPRAWLITDGNAGNERQAQALASAMGLDARELHIALRPPWSWFAPRAFPGAWDALPAELRAASEQDPPAIVIGCGRSAALATALLRARTRAFAVQILDPRVDARRWDLVITPAHDRLRGDNVLNTIGALNSITPARLAAAALATPGLAQLPAPRTAVLIGGTTRAQRIDAGWIASLADRLGDWHAQRGGSFLVSTSRRTAPETVAAARSAFAAWPGAFWSGPEDGDNPYLAFLAHANAIVVSPDSVNQLSEASATGKPVYTHAPRPVHGKLVAFLRELVDSGHVRPLRSEPGAYEPRALRETDAVAEEVWRRWRAHSR